jgi:hypothetical protein
VFALLKSAYCDNVERIERVGVNAIGKQHFTALYSPVRELSFTRRNILIGWSKSGLFPFDPQRVLRDIEKPTNTTQPLTADAANFRFSVQHVTAALCANPLTPITPVIVEAFISLRDLIVY